MVSFVLRNKCFHFFVKEETEKLIFHSHSVLKNV